jgi:putative flippase GtrA
MKLYRQAGLYYIISGITVVINLLVYGFLIYVCRVDYLWAATIGFVIENVLDYVGERKWVFKRTRVKPAAGYVRSLCVALAVLALILGLTYAGFHILGMNYLWARIFAGILAGIVSFVLDEKFTFVV